GEGAAVEHEVRGSVGGEQQLVDAARDQGVVDPRDVRVVVAVAAVLVLDLDGDDGPAAVGLERGDARHDLVEPGRDGVEVDRVGRAQAYAGRPGEPRGEAAVRPLGADVRARPHDGVHAEVPDEAQEPLEVTVAVEHGAPALGLVPVPRHVGVDGVEAHRAHAAQAVGPQVGVHAEVVHGPGEDAVLDAVPQEATTVLDEGRRAARARHLMAPAARPERQKRWRHRNATTSGTTATNAPTMTMCRSIWPACTSAFQLTSPTVTGRRSPEMSTWDGRRKLFQISTNWKRKIVTSAGAIMRRLTPKKIRPSFAPSRRAASMTSSGTELAAKMRPR